ncbi:MFS transporter [Rothia nasimurium]|uniref:MFS transporter n=1 Tax=Luteibacter anthropi TaxID=564369 RepID=A0A7X5ZJK7_9GAMM|nr:MFS transporter [Luteibacter anthropi]NII07850.1 MFS transporter [Luteibacter anthropi]
MSPQPFGEPSIGPGGSLCAAPEAPVADTAPFPLAGLIALASGGFITIITEALPAGLLPTMSAGLGISQALVGQLVTIYAIGSLLTAIPLVAATRHLGRKPLLMTAMAGFLFANTITAMSSSYPLILVARLIAGVSAGLLWALLAGYATRMVSPSQQTRAMAIAMAGAPLALSLGIPAGTLLGQQIGWRWSFGIMSMLSFVLLVWVRATLPDFAGQRDGGPLDLRRVFRLPGVAQVLGTMLVFVLAHNVLYTYVAPVLAVAGVGDKVDRYLMLFGVASIVGIWVAGALGDRMMRTLVLLGIVGFLGATAAIALWPASPAVLAVALGVWGLAFGGSPALLQTALSRNAGESADVAQSLLVTGWNTAVAGGGLLGGVILDGVGATALSWVVLPMLAITLWIGWHPRAWQKLV